MNFKKENGMKNEIIKITPEQAKNWLKFNFINRPIRPSFISTYATSMKQGKWILSHQGIAFDKAGRLVDGQHRLSAIIMANTPVDMLVTTDASDELFKVVDNGAKRSIADNTRLDRRLAESCSFMLRVVYGISNENKTVDPDLVLYLSSSPFGYWHQKLLEAYPSKAGRSFQTAASRAAAAVQIMLTNDFCYVSQIYKSLLSMDFDLMTSPAKYIFKYEHQSKQGSASGNKLEFYTKMLKVYDPQNKDLKIVRATPSEIFNFREISKSVICLED